MREFRKIFTSIDRTQPWYSFAFTGALVAAAATSGLLSDWSDLHLRWGAVLFFAALALMAELFYVDLPVGSARVSVGFAIELAAVLVFPPHEAALVAAGGVLLANVWQRLPGDVILFNAAQVWSTTGATALVWHYLWPTDVLAPDTTVAWLYLTLALLACATVYFLLNTLLFSVSVWLAHRLRFREVLDKNVLWLFPNHLALGALGFLVVVIYTGIGMYGVLLLWIPLLIARYSFQKYMDIRAAHLQTIQSLALALDAKDHYTRGHSERVARYAVEIAKEMKLGDGEVEMLHYAGILHDIGKIGISDAVLHKVGRLTDDEYELVKSHSEIGSRVVGPVGFLHGISDVIRHHHERVDGLGYPDGLKGDEIPLGARIMAVADAFDAMTFDRVYRQGMEPAVALRQIIKGKGTQFDPDVVDIFVRRVLPRHVELSLDLSSIIEDGPDIHGDSLWKYLIERERGKWASARAAREQGIRRKRPHKGRRRSPRAVADRDDSVPANTKP